MRILLAIVSTSLALTMVNPVLASNEASADAAACLKRIADLPATPALPPNLKRKIELILDSKSPAQGALSSDGKSLYFTWAVTGVPHVWKVESGKAFPKMLTAGEDKTSIAGILPDTSALIVSRDPGGAENTLLYLMDTNGGELKPIIANSKVQASLQFISSDSKRIYYSANSIREADFTLFEYNIATQTSSVLYDGEGSWEILDEKNGDFLLQKFLGNHAQQIYLLPKGAKEPIGLLGIKETDKFSASFNTHGPGYLVRTSFFGDFEVLYRWNPSQSPEAGIKKEDFTQISPQIPAELDAFKVDRAGKRLYIEFNDKGYSRVEVLDAKTLEPLKIPAELKTGDHLTYGSTTADGRFAVFAVGRHDSPLKQYVYDWDTSELKEMIAPSTPEVDASKFAKPSLEYYTSRDGVEIPMFVRRPVNCDPTKCPVIVSFHGGPEGQSVAGYALSAQLFVDQGFIYVEPNVRGSTGYGKDWMNADNGPKRLDVIGDIQDVATHIRKNWFKGAAGKIGIMGGSYGGYSTLMGMTYFSGTFDAGVSIVGISDLRTFLKNTAPYRRKLREIEYGYLGTDDAALEQLSPMVHLNKIKAPLMLIQGANDPRVPLSEALQIYDAMKAKDLPIELIVFADEGHGAAKRGNQVTYLGGAIRFFVKHLKGEELK